MQRKDLALRVLSTAAIMSIVTSIAAPAFAGTYYMDNGNLSIRQDAEGKVWVKSGSEEKQDTDDEVIIHGGSGVNQWSNVPSGGAAAGEGTSATGGAALTSGAPAAEEQKLPGEAADEQQPDPNAGSTLNETKEGSAQTQEGSAQTQEGSTLNETKEGSAQTQEDSAQTQQGKDNTKEEDTPKDPSTEPTLSASAAPAAKTPETTQADTTTTPAAETEPSTELKDVTVDTAYKPAAPTSAASSNWISVINNCVDKVLNIRLRDVNIKKTSNDDTAPMTVDGSGNTTIELDGNNVLDAHDESGINRTHAAGLEKKGTGTLTITDTGSITAEDGTTQDNKRRGSLTATGSWGPSGGAGIGSRGNVGATSVTIENITIEGNAYVKAYGQGNASGIGGGYDGNAKNIIIKDNAYVVAKGGCAGIGSGCYGGSSDVKIQDGTVVAEGYYTGIGGHYMDSDTSGTTETSTIEISGGTVYAKGDGSTTSGDGVSIGSTGRNSNITISGDAKVKNTGRMGSHASYDVKDKGISSTIIIKDNAMIADGSGAIGGDTSTNITIQDNAVIGNLLKFGPRHNEWSGYIGTMADYWNNAKTTIQIKNNALIKDVIFIGGKSAEADIKIQDNAHIKNIYIGGTSYNIPAIGSDSKKAEVTIGGSSDPNTQQQGTVRIDEAQRDAMVGGGDYTVIGSVTGGGNVSITGNVQLGLVSKGADYNYVSYVKGNSVMTLDEMKNSIRGDSTMSLMNKQTNKLEYIVHGENVCAHVDGEVVKKVDATCTEDGYIEYRCNYEKENHATGNSCNRTWTKTIPKKGHTWGEWTVKTPATCEGEGEEERECSVCHQKETRKITALDHLWKEDHRTGNCGVAGDIYYVCERDHNHTKTEPVAATGNHQFNDWHQTKAPTCMEKGEEKRECKVCGKPETREVDKLDHVEELRGAKEPTCTEPGYTGDKWCTRGDHLLEKGSVIPATGHHWKDNGDGTHTCPDCGATEGQPFNTNSALELRVVDAEGMNQPFTVSQNGTLRTYTGAYDIATLTGDLDTLRYLQDHGAQTIQFVTNGQTSSFDINDLLAQGSGSEVFYLTHRGAEEPTLLLVEADHSELVKD